MTDPLSILWASFDTDSPTYTAEVCLGWPEGWFDWLVREQLLIPCENASHVVCTSCSEHHVEQVIARAGPAGTRRFYIPCPEAGRVEIEPDSLRQWRPDYKRFARSIKEAMSFPGRATERVPNRVWRLGAISVKGKSREVLLVRGICWADSKQLASQLEASGGSVLLIGEHWPILGTFTTSNPAIVPLPAVFSCNNSSLQIDGALMIQMIAEADAIARCRGAMDDAQLRQRMDSLIERRFAEGPKNEMLLSLSDQGMSNRQIAKNMTDRGMPLDQSTVGRRLQKGRPRTQRGSSSSILRTGSSQPRNKRNRPIADAQPREET